MKDYFILPDVFDFSLIKDVVIGREKIDNYMMSLMYDYRGYLIDTTEKSTLMAVLLNCSHCIPFRQGGI